ELPEKVTVEYSDETTAEVAVVWKTIDSSDYEEGGTFRVTGEVEGTEEEAEAAVTVEVVEPEPEIESITPVEVTTDVGAAPELPEKVTVEYSDETTAEVAVVWEAIDSSDYEEGGTFRVIGEVEGTEIAAEAEVEV